MSKDPMQDLLNLEANSDLSEEYREEIRTMLRLMRTKTGQPHCFGDDDCSSWMLATCPWRFDCGRDDF